MTSRQRFQRLLERKKGPRGGGWMVRIPVATLDDPSVVLVPELRAKLIRADERRAELADCHIDLIRWSLQR